MIEFRVIKKSKKSDARLGILKTPHGEIETPAFVSVATQATIRTLTSDEAEKTGSGIAICNTFHLHLKPGEQVVKKAGGLHKFMDWKKPLMTDSGGFQVFSLGFGRELGVSKVVKKDSGVEVKHDQKPKSIKILANGVEFRSPIDGSRLFLGPRESIRIQEMLGADIAFAFDECPPPNAERAYMSKSLERTHAWARICLDSRKTNQALYGIVQGGRYKDLRIQSSEIIGGMEFDGFGIGGEFGDSKLNLEKMLKTVYSVLPREKPTHLLGIGHPEDILPVVRSGVDTFDCIVPTHYARHGICFTSRGRIDFKKKIHSRDFRPISAECSCYTCTRHTRAYVSHLFRAKEILALTLATIHNLHYFNSKLEKIRYDIRIGKV